MESLTPEQYRDMLKNVLEFRALNGQFPEYTTVDGCRIEKKEYLDMIERVNEFFLLMGRNPGSIDIGPEDDPCCVPEKLLVH